MTSSSNGNFPPFVSWMIRLLLQIRTQLSPHPSLKETEEMKSWGLLSKGILFQFVSSSMHVSSDSSLPYPLVCAVDTRCEHGFSAVITQNPNTDMTQVILLMPQPKNPFSPPRYCNSELWKLTFSCVSCALFSFSDPSPSYDISYIETTFYYYSYSCDFYLRSYSNVYCSSDCNFANWFACTGDIL